MTHTTQTPESNPRNLVDGKYVEKVQGTPQIAVTAAVKRPERDVLNSELEVGDVIIGDNGSGRLEVYEAGSSSALPGCVRIETNFGPIYLDADGSSRIAADADKHYSFDFDTMTEDDAGDVFQAAKLKFGHSGTYYGRCDVDSAIDSYFECLDEDDESSDEDVDRDAVWQIVRHTYTWRNMADRMAESVNENIDDRVAEAVVEVLALAAAKAAAEEPKA